jgi:glycosyltransferase EpsF
MEKIKVLVVTATMNAGGLENQLMHLLRNADKETFQIDFSSKVEDSYYRKEIEDLGAKYHVLPEMNRKNMFSYFRTMIRIMKDGKYDVVHSNELFHSGIVLLASYFAGVKCRIAHSHSIYDLDDINAKRSSLRKMYSSFMRWLILRCSTIQIGCSTAAGEFLFGKKAVKKDTYHLLFNSVDTSEYIENYEREETGEFCESEWINILHIGRVYEVKNQLFITEIAEEFKKRDKKIRILCAGNGNQEYLDKVQAVIKSKELQNHMTMLGVRKDVSELLRKSKAFILPSLYEGMPLVLIEAQASGIHCVSADTFSKEVDFGIEAIEWLSLQAGAERWADAIETATEKGRKQKSEVVNAIEEKGFDSRIFTEKLCKLYEQNVRK